MRKISECIPAVIDFETFYDKNYTLSKLTTEAYIRDPRFEVIMLSLWFANEPVRIITGTHEEIRAQLLEYPWHKTYLGAHNCAFDAAILCWIFGITPAYLFCTQRLAAPFYGHTHSLSLASLSETRGLPPKGTAVHNMLGKRRLDLTPQEFKEYADYCGHDGWLCKQLFLYFAPRVPEHELYTLSASLKMFTQPQLQLDPIVLTDALADEGRKRATILTDIAGLLGAPGQEATVKDALSSNDKFAALLNALGVDVPVKVGKKGAIPALAKTDPGFEELLHAPDPLIRTLCEGRLLVKSTQAESRAQRLLDIAQRGPMPFPVHWCGALAAHRWAAWDAVNVQNFQRGGFLRRSIVAPKGWKLIVADLSQIELRVGWWLAGEWENLQRFAHGGHDPYRQIITDTFGMPYESIAKGSIERQTGKVICIAEGEPVLTRDRGLVPIESVILDDYVWDGVEWVEHTGVVCNGEQIVMTYDGLTATPDHMVWTSDGEKTRLDAAATSGKRLACTGISRAPLPFVADCAASSATPRSWQLYGVNRMRMWAKSVAAVIQRFKWQGALLSPMRQPMRTTGTRAFCIYNGCGSAVSKAGKRNDAAVPQSTRQKLRAIWGTRNRISLLLHCGMLSLYKRISRLGERPALVDRSYRQQRTLRIGQSTSSYCNDADGQSAQYSLYDVPATTDTCARGLSCITLSCAGSAIRAEYSREISEGGFDNRTDDRPVLHTPIRQTKRVYDITNAGPRHRFTVSGRLVSNCLSGIYATGAKKARHTVRVQAGKTISLSEAKALIDTYRLKNRQVVNAWKQGESALAAMYAAQPTFVWKDSIVVMKEGLIKPDGLPMLYPQLRPHTGQWGDGSPKQEWTYERRKGRVMVTDHLYGGKLFQNMTQSLSRDIMSRIIARWVVTLPEPCMIAGTVHDEGIILAPDDIAESVADLVKRDMVLPPPWALDLPLATEVSIGTCYGDIK